MGNLVFTDDERYRKINKRQVHYCFILRKRTFICYQGELNANQSPELMLFLQECEKF